MGLGSFHKAASSPEWLNFIGGRFWAWRTWAVSDKAEGQLVLAMALVQVSDVTESRLLSSTRLTAALPCFQKLCSVSQFLLRTSFMSAMSKKRTIDSFFTPPSKQRKVDEPDAQEVSVCLR